MVQAACYQVLVGWVSYGALINYMRSRTDLHLGGTYVDNVNGCDKG